MHHFNYIIIPALFLINMGVDGATIANTLTSAHHPIRDSPARAVASLQNRQYHTADFSSDPSSTTDEPAHPDPADTDDHPQDISRPEFFPRGSVFPSLPLGDGKVLARGDRPAINFRQPLRRADFADFDVVLPRLDSGLSMNAMSDVLPNGSAKPLSDPLATPDASNLPANDPPTSNVPADDPPASNAPATTSPPGTFGSSPVSNAVGTSNLMNSALGSGGVRDELSNFGSRDIALSHGMGSVSVTRDLEMARATTDDAAEDLEEEGTDESDMDDVGEVNDESDTAENVDEDIDESDMDDVAENVAEISNASDTAENVEEDTNEDDDDAGDGALESRQHSTRLSSSRVRQRPHVAHGPHVAVPSKVAKMTKVMKGKNKLETAGERMVEKKSQQAVKEGGQHVHGA